LYVSVRNVVTCSNLLISV